MNIPINYRNCQCKYCLGVAYPFYFKIEQYNDTQLMDSFKKWVEAIFDMSRYKAEQNKDYDFIGIINGLHERYNAFQPTPPTQEKECKDGTCYKGSGGGILCGKHLGEFKESKKTTQEKELDWRSAVESDFASETKPTQDTESWEEEFESLRPKTDDKLLKTKKNSEEYYFGYKHMRGSEIFQVTDWRNIKNWIKQKKQEWEATSFREGSSIMKSEMEIDIKQARTQGAEAAVDYVTSNDNLNWFKNSETHSEYEKLLYKAKGV